MYQLAIDHPGKGQFAFGLFVLGKQPAAPLALQSLLQSLQDLVSGTVQPGCGNAQLSEPQGPQGLFGIEAFRRPGLQTVASNRFQPLMDDGTDMAALLRCRSQNRFF